MLRSGITHFCFLFWPTFGRYLIILLSQQYNTHCTAFCSLLPSYINEFVFPMIMRHYFYFGVFVCTSEKEGSAVSLLQAKTGFQKLAQLDGVRVKYWTRREECVILTMSSTGADAHVTDNLPAPP